MLTTGAAGMRDWASHLAAMQRDKNEHVANAQAIWVKAYRAAPTNINAFNRRRGLRPAEVLARGSRLTDLPASVG